MSKIQSFSMIDSRKNREYCDYDGYSHTFPFDLWAGARKACSDLGLILPTREVLCALLNTNDSNLPKTGKFVTNSPYGAGYYYMYEMVFGILLWSNVWK